MIYKTLKIIHVGNYLQDPGVSKVIFAEHNSCLPNFDRIEPHSKYVSVTKKVLKNSVVVHC